MLKKLFLLVLLLSIASICFAQDTGEQITITTYYPSPYGVYKTLRLFPYAECGTGTCQDGEMCAKEPSDEMYSCKNNAWQPISGGFVKGIQIFTKESLPQTGVAHYWPGSSVYFTTIHISPPSEATYFYVTLKVDIQAPTVACTGTDITGTGHIAILTLNGELEQYKDYAHCGGAGWRTIVLTGRQKVDSEGGNSINVRYAGNLGNTPTNLAATVIYY